MQAIDCGMLHLASGGSAAQRRQQSGDSRASSDQNIPVLEWWHASVAKNTAAKFAVEQELLRQTNLKDLFLCNLDGDNMFAGTFPEWTMRQTGHWLCCCTHTDRGIRAC